jgi:hypothetical protein
MEDIYNELMWINAGYYGIEMCDEYLLKEYALNDVSKYIEEFISTNKITFNLYEEAKKLSDRVKLQDALLLLNRMKYSMELVFIIKNKLKLLGKRDYF